MRQAIRPGPLGRDSETLIRPGLKMLELPPDCQWLGLTVVSGSYNVYSYMNSYMNPYFEHEFIYEFIKIVFIHEFTYEFICVNMNSIHI